VRVPSLWRTSPTPRPNLSHQKQHTTTAGMAMDGRTDGPALAHQGQGRGAVPVQDPGIMSLNTK
jgi:hypothetical protein